MLLETPWEVIERDIKTMGSNKKSQHKQDPNVSMPIMLTPLNAEAKGLAVPGQPKLHENLSEEEKPSNSNKNRNRRVVCLKKWSEGMKLHSG